jgi:hypothetical protein
MKSGFDMYFAFMNVVVKINAIGWQSQFSIQISGFYQRGNDFASN